MGVDQASLEALFHQDLAVHNRPQYSYNKHAPDKLYRNRYFEPIAGFLNHWAIL